MLRRCFFRNTAFLLIISACLLSIGGRSVHAEGGIMVWKLEGGKGVDDKTVTTISNFITGQVAKYSEQKIISEADIYTIIKGEQTKQRCGVEDTSCIAEIGAALGVPEAVSGDLGRMGDYWILNIKRINIRKAVVIKRVSRSILGDTNALIEALPGAVAELFGKKAKEAAGPPPLAAAPVEKPKEKPKPKPAQPKPPEQGLVDISSEPSGAELFMNGEAKGKTPFKKKIMTGEYELALAHDGYRSASEAIVVHSKGTRRMHFRLERIYPMNPYKKWGHVTFWSGAGMAAILGGLGFGLGSKYADDYQNNSSGSITDLRNKSQTMTGVGYAGISIGGALMITGIVLWAISPGDEAWWSEHDLSAGLSTDGKASTLSFYGRW